MRLKHIIMPALALVLLSTGEVSARRLKNEFFYNRLCSSNRYMGCCSLNEFGIRCSDEPTHNGNREWTCVLSKDEGAHVRYECQRLGWDQKFLVDVYSVGLGKDGKCGVRLRSEMVRDGYRYKIYKDEDFLHRSNGILDRYLTAETTDCGATMTAPPLKRKWRHAPAAETDKFKNPIFGEYCWSGKSEEVRLYPDKIIEYSQYDVGEVECLLIENEAGRIMYECDDRYYDDLEHYGGKDYWLYELKYVEGVGYIESMTQKIYDKIGSNFSSLRWYSGISFGDSCENSKRFGLSPAAKNDNNRK